MKVGDRVTIRDYSYVRSVVDGKLTHSSPNYHDDGEREYTVVETGCSFPLVNQDCIPTQEARFRNDTVIQDENGKVVFIHSGFLDEYYPEPKHVWKNGDVFKIQDYPMIYLCEGMSLPRAHHLTPSHMATCSIESYLKDATFLFNIAEKL